MTASLQALIRAIDALKHHEPEVEGPQGATENIPVAPDNLLEKQAQGHTSHRGHSQTIDHGEKQKQELCKASDRVHARKVSPPKVYIPSVAPVAHVALGIDSKGENRGHTARSCGPLWPPPGFPRVSEPAGIPDEWLAGAARLPTMARMRDYCSCLARHQPRTAPSDEDLLAMRRAAWRSQGVVVLKPDDVRDDWTHQALINEANRLYGRRAGGGQ
jgi:hypothetical protein